MVLHQGLKAVEKKKKGLENQKQNIKVVLQNNINVHEIILKWKLFWEFGKRSHSDICYCKMQNAAMGQEYS